MELERRCYFLISWEITYVQWFVAMDTTCKNVEKNDRQRGRYSRVLIVEIVGQSGTGKSSAIQELTNLAPNISVHRPIDTTRSIKVITRLLLFIKIFPQIIRRRVSFKENLYTTYRGAPACYALRALKKARSTTVFDEGVVRVFRDSGCASSRQRMAWLRLAKIFFKKILDQNVNILVINLCLDPDEARRRDQSRKEKRIKSISKVKMVVRLKRFLLSMQSSGVSTISKEVDVWLHKQSRRVRFVSHPVDANDTPRSVAEDMLSIIRKVERELI